MAAESVGLAASVAGLVSLGLQVTDGIFKYVDAFDNRQEDLAFVRQQNEALRTTLQVIKEYVGAQGSSPELAVTVSGSLQSFETALGKIEALHAELVDSGDKTWTSRLDNRRKRFKYPFNRSKIQQLGHQLENARGTLQLTLNALDMRISRKQHTETLTAMEVSFRGLSSETQLIRSSLSAVETPIIDIKEQLSMTHEAVNASTRLLVSQYGTIANQAQQSNQVFLGKFQETANLVQRLAELCSKQHLETIETIERLAVHTHRNHRPNHAPVALVRKLADKPALLKEVGNAIQSFEQAQDQVVALNLPTQPLRDRTRLAASVGTPQLQSLLGRICICPRQRSVRERRWIQLGNSSFFGDWETRTHWHACPLSKTSRNERRVAVGLNYTGLVRILKTAINMSFVLTHGAGGFSISPSFACTPTVDYKLDPAFRVLDLIRDGFRYLRNDSEHLMLAGMKRLIRLLDDVKVCPTAVDEHNESLMHRAIAGLCSWAIWHSSTDTFETLRLFVELVQTLLSYGVAPFTYNKWGLSPMLQMPPGSVDSELIQPVIEVLLKANLESQPLALDESSIFRSYRGYFSFETDLELKYEIYSGFAEACECGPLSIAVIQNDPVAVDQILNRNPQAMNEINLFGQSPFHLAATSPWILDILLGAGYHNLLDHRDTLGLTALEIAMIRSSNFCINGQGTQRCYDHECDCCQCIDLFLAAECSVRTNKLDYAFRLNPVELCSILGNASELARRKYVFRMKQSRMTIQSPHPWEVSSGPDSGVADDLSWIFNEIADPHLGELFYRYGFRPHASCLIHFRGNLGKNIMNSAYLHWLMSHGVDILFRSPLGPPLLEESPNHGLFGAHFAFHFIGLGFVHDPGQIPMALRSDDSVNTSVELMTEIYRRDLTDGCQCHCTVDGCTPFTWMMAGELTTGTDQSRCSTSPIPGSLFFHYMNCGPELTTLTYKAAIRYATFTALNLSHTCCGAWDIAHDGHERVQRDANDIKTINEKQAIPLETLEELVLEFEEKAVEYLGTDSKSGQGTFHKFWSEYWERRMDEELARLHDKESKDAEKGAQGNGIHSWGPHREVKEENPYDKNTDLKYWLYELDKICPEYSKPWAEDPCRIVEEP